MRHVGKIAVFIAGVLILIMILDIPFRGGYWFTKGYLAARDCRIAGIQEEPEGQIDVLIVDGLDYLSCNWDIDKIGIDYSTDYFDEDANHLNLSGVRKVTTYLAEYLVNECILTDHRGDPAYRSWDELLPVYDREVQAMAGTSYSQIEKAQKKKKE